MLNIADWKGYPSIQAWIDAIKKPGSSIQAFFVAGIGEISNLELLKDIDNVIEYVRYGWYDTVADYDRIRH